MKTISLLLISFLLVFAADGPNCITLHDDRSETSSEKYSECSPDAITSRHSRTVQTGVTCHLKNALRYQIRFFQGSHSSFVYIIKKPTICKVYLDIASIALSTTVIRI
jgi:uncharacterized protein